MFQPLFVAHPSSEWAEAPWFGRLSRYVCVRAYRPFRRMFVGVDDIGRQILRGAARNGHRGGFRHIFLSDVCTWYKLRHTCSGVSRRLSCSFDDTVGRLESSRKDARGCRRMVRLRLRVCGWKIYDIETPEGTLMKTSGVPLWDGRRRSLRSCTSRIAGYARCENLRFSGLSAIFTAWKDVCIRRPPVSRNLSAV